MVVVFAKSWRTPGASGETITAKPLMAIGPPGTHFPAFIPEASKVSKNGSCSSLATVVTSIL